MITRKHFEAAALLASRQSSQTKRRIIADAFVALFDQFNPRFDRDRFYTKVETLAASQR